MVLFHVLYNILFHYNYTCINQSVNCRLIPSWYVMVVIVVIIKYRQDSQL